MTPVPDRSSAKCYVRIVGKPIPHFGGEVRTKVVHHNMKFAFNVLRGDRLYEENKLLRTASEIAFTGDFSSRDVQRAERVDCAMPDLVVSPFLCFVEGHGKKRLSTVECLQSPG